MNVTGYSLSTRLYASIGHMFGDRTNSKLLKAVLSFSTQFKDFSSLFKTGVELKAAAGTVSVAPVWHNQLQFCEYFKTDIRRASASCLMPSYEAYHTVMKSSRHKLYAVHTLTKPSLRVIIINQYSFIIMLSDATPHITIISNTTEHNILKNIKSSNQ